MNENTNTTAVAAPAGAMRNIPAFYSVSAETKEERAALYNAINVPDARISEMINKVIMLRDVIVEPVEVVNETTGVIEVAPRIILLDAEGHSYQGVSSGIYNALNRLIAVFGSPTYDDPIPVRIIQVERGKNRIYSLEVVTE